MAQTNEEVRDTELHQEEIRPDATATDPVVTSVRLFGPQRQFRYLGNSGR